MKLLIATDAFPPVCGGSGWSTYELARGLRERGHDITIVQPVGGSETTRPTVGGSNRTRPTTGTREYDGFGVIEFHYWAPRVPFVRNYFKNERLSAALSAFLERLIADRGIELVHAQHLLTGPGSIRAARRSGIPGVCTIRDYWPICYWSDLIHDESSEGTCPGCTASMMTRCVRPHAGATWPLALPMIPYMRANLRFKRSALAQASAIVAVSDAVAHLVRTRGPELSSSRIEVIPNPVDVQAIQLQAGRQPSPQSGPYAVFVGKLERNKGMAALMTLLERVRLEWPLVIVGDGAERSALESAARRSSFPVHFTGWLPRERVLGWIRHAAFVVFPSRWPEPLSRVLLEASALGVPVAALETGGTRDVIIDGETGCLAADVTGFIAAVDRLRRDEALRVKLGAAARRHVESRFETSVVVRRMEELYRSL